MRLEGLLATFLGALVLPLVMGWATSGHAPPPGGPAAFGEPADPLGDPAVTTAYDGLGRDFLRRGKAVPADVARLAALNRRPGWRPVWNNDALGSADDELVRAAFDRDHIASLAEGGLFAAKAAGLAELAAGRQAGAIAAAIALAASARRLQEAPGDPAIVSELAFSAADELGQLTARLPAPAAWSPAEQAALRAALGGPAELLPQLLRQRNALWGAYARGYGYALAGAHGAYTDRARAVYVRAADQLVAALVAGKPQPPAALQAWAGAQRMCWNDEVVPSGWPHLFHGEDRASSAAMMGLLRDAERLDPDVGITLADLAKTWREVDARLAALRVGRKP